MVYVRGLDLLDHTPVLDIKPYIPAFDSFPSARAGWLDDIDPNPARSRIQGYQTFNMHPREKHLIEASGNDFDITDEFIYKQHNLLT
jgi:tRNA-methyltransferase O